MSIFGINPSSQGQTPPAIQQTQEPLTQIIDILKSFADDQAGLKSINDKPKLSKQTTMPEKKSDSSLFNGLESAIMALANPDDSDPISAKKRRLTQKKMRSLFSLADQLEDSVNLDGLSDSERTTLSAFIQNLKKLRQLNQEIVLIDNQHDHYQKILDANSPSIDQKN
jgi:DNA-nicking Smr family endonuclease